MSTPASNTPAVRITTKRAGFRRAGMAHADTPVIHPPGTFTVEQIKALTAEPMLLVDVAATATEDWDDDQGANSVEAPEAAAGEATEEPPGKPQGAAKAGAKDPTPPKGGAK